MNVGEWLAQYMPNRRPTVYRRPSDNEDMVEIEPCCFVNRKAYDFGLGKPTVVARNVTGEAIKNAPIGNSLTPWRMWLNSEGNEWTRKWSWL